jgi:hypothetical protein
VKGDAGTPGSNGTSATTESFSGVKGSCTAGGVVVKSASPEVNVCNGKNGTTGFTSTLPSGKTETGTWAYFASAGETSPVGLQGISVPISLNIPLATPITVANTQIFAGTTIPAGCSGSVVEGKVLELTAEPGHFCLHIAQAEGGVSASELHLADPEAQLESGVGTSGAVLFSLSEGSRYSIPEGTSGAGTWAVTAE